MIARLWRGWTTSDHADAYEALFREHILPSVLAVPGCHGAELLRREDAGEVEFVAVSYFDSKEAVARFAGREAEKAVIRAEARPLLSRFEERARHYRVVVPR
jgi:heme-degrading monooxygenase HmoA